MLKVSPFVRASKGEDGPELWITGEIGVDTVATDVVRAIKFYNDQGDTPILNIYSHGGMVDDANAFYGYVEKSGIKAIVRIWGTAMSATVTYAAAFGRDAIEIHPLATIMIHEASGGTDEMREAGNNGMVAVYRRLSGLSDAKLRAMMSATTTLTAKEAVDMGFAGKVMKSELKLAAMHEAKPFEPNEQPQMMQVKGKLVDLVAVKGQAATFEIDPTAELKDAADALATATADRIAAEAKEKEATDKVAALETSVKEANDKATAAEEKATADVAEVTAKLETVTKAEADKDAVIANLKADVAKLKTLPTAKALDLSGDGKAVDPAGEGKNNLTAGEAIVKTAMAQANPLQIAQAKMEAAKEAKK